jgi:hypothetical protein
VCYTPLRVPLCNYGHGKPAFMVVWNIQALLDWFILHIDIKRAKLPSSLAIHDMCSLEPGGYGPVIRMKEGKPHK